MGRIIFVTGTDTGVGKTLLTASLLFHLRSKGQTALALKPFCSGGREDALLLHSLQEGDITLEEVNPFYFRKPLAPYLAASPKQRRELRVEKVVAHIQKQANRCEVLLVEGAGGLLVPVGENLFIRDLIGAIDCEVIVVAVDRLGTLNHTLLTVKSLPQRALHKGCKVVLMGQGKADLSARTNAKFLGKALARIPVVRVGFLGAGARRLSAIKAHEKKVKKALALLVV